MDSNIFGVFGYKRTGAQESRKEKSKYEYIKELNIYCEKETGEVLEYSGLIDKNGYKTYRNLDEEKVVRRHIHEEWNEYFHELKKSDEGEELYDARKNHVKRSFAVSKQNHGYRYAMYKGVKKNQHVHFYIYKHKKYKV